MTDIIVKLYSRDYSSILFETDTIENATQFLIDNAEEYLPMVIDYGNTYKQRWSGRLERDGRSYNDLDYIEYLTTWPNPCI